MTDNLDNGFHPRHTHGREGGFYDKEAMGYTTQIPPVPPPDVLSRPTYLPSVEYLSGYEDGYVDGAHAYKPILAYILCAASGFVSGSFTVALYFMAIAR